MRFHALTLAAAALVLGACGGKDNGAAKTDSTNTATATSTTTSTDNSANAGATSTATGSSAAAPAGGAAAGSAAAKPATGKTVEVKMIGDEKGYRFEPANITIKAGDAIKWINVTGGPHNVSFDPATVPAAAKGQLSSNMPNQMSDLVGPLLTDPNAAYTISFAGVPAGTYNYFCTPHLAMGMKGTITVQ